MDTAIEEYLRRLQLSIDAMMALDQKTPESIKQVVSDNFWQTQSAFDAKVKRSIDFSRGEKSSR